MSAALNIPSLIARLGRRVPGPFVSLHFVAGLEVARRLKWLEPPAELEGRSFAITVEDLGLRSSFVVRNGAFRPQWDRAGGGGAELELGAKLADFLALMRAETDADTLFFQRRLRISGDTELGLIVKNWLDASPRPAWLQKMSGAGSGVGVP
ncbi:ubiquinone anaerobic biosynthesis accessory factor UbiT [Achromobacter arsenitoxydans]|uniref:Ubiquinone biosynthesis accessory factor UbiT n=1 Tax=Achromobacter arsenitoxydans SY8 TaxID=477184 RepID=H0FBX7_9BURK|nr:SCP2 sterol-binding domain-containing protein [Achromobacter arsenitoxydans]EHK64253.1 sterol-binding domain-containing protein [Achromobacter arsenitoxydans SY8]